MQINVRQNRRHYRALWGSPQVVLPFGSFHDAGVQPFPDQADDPPVANPVLQEPDHPVPVDPVEIRPDIRIDYPSDLAPIDPESQGIERIMCSTPGPEPIAESEELRLVNRQKDGLSHRLLDDLVFQRCDAQRSCSPVRFGYFYPP